MSMRIGVPKEVHPDECRVAVTPETAEQLKKLGYTLSIESGAGSARYRHVKFRQSRGMDGPQREQPRSQRDGHVSPRGTTISGLSNSRAGPQHALHPSHDLYFAGRASLSPIPPGSAWAGRGVEWLAGRP